jgi:hypothetical protein
MMKEDFDSETNAVFNTLFLVEMYHYLNLKFSEL